MPTLMVLPSLTPLTPALPQAETRAFATIVLPTPSATPISSRATVAPAPQATGQAAAFTPVVPNTQDLTPTTAFSPTTHHLPPTTVLPQPPISNPQPLLLGYSAGGRPIEASFVGTGERTLVLVGAIHGGWEWNTAELVGQLYAHFAAQPGDLPAGTRIAFIAAANPDGLAAGRGEDARFNGNGVDLNRNWGCDWSSEAVWRNRPVNPGARAMSEPETAALAAFFAQIRPAAALFYHSAAGGVFAGACGGDGLYSQELAAIYGGAAGYSFDQPFTAYPVTGTAASWADGQGIAAADVELFSHDDAEFARNLDGVRALLAWLAEGQ